MTVRLALSRSRQPLHRALLCQQLSGGGGGASCSAAHVRRASMLSPPAPPPAPTLPPLSPAASLTVAHEHLDGAPTPLRDSFASAFKRAAHEVGDSNDFKEFSNSLPTSSTASAQLSPWLQYLVGLSSHPPSAAATKEEGEQLVRPSSSSSDTSAGAWAADSLFFHHIFSNAKEAKLYVTVRQPREFLRPAPLTGSGGSGGGAHAKAQNSPHRLGSAESVWSLTPFGGVLHRVERVLHEMARRERTKAGVKASSSTQEGHEKATFVLTFWRAMLEQAFLEQYCEVAALNTVSGDVARDPKSVNGDATQSASAASHTVFDLYPFDYRDQPAELRQRLEECVRALLCASAFTLHAQWEQFMTRHGPTDTVAHVLGLELFLLWWYANPDQVPVELTSSVHRLPPCTLRQQARLDEVGDGDTAGTLHHSALWRSSMATAGKVATVEQHLREYIAALHDTEAVARTGGIAAQRTSSLINSARRAGGFLCPAAVFPPSYRDALRAHLRQVRHHGDLITCPLFVRVLEVAVMVGSVEPQGWEDAASALAYTGTTRSTTHAAAQWHATGEMSSQVADRRGREVAEQLIADWLWPTVCPTTTHTTPQSEPDTLTRHVSATHTTAAAAAAVDDTATEKVEDWAVLVAVVTAVAQVRGHLLALRRGSSGRRRATTASGSTGAADDGGSGARDETVAHLRDHVYTPAMRVLLGAFAKSTTDPSDGLPIPEQADREEVCVIDSTAAALPSWTYLVFAHVIFCFQDCGWLRRNVVQQPATPARLWHQLFHTMCAAFPHVFCAGNAVTVLWTHLAMEGAAAAPSNYYSAYQPLSKGRAEAVLAWTDVLARSHGVASLDEDTGDAADTASSAELTVGSDAECFAGSQELAGIEDALCPRAELRERSAYVAAAASGESQQPQLGALPAAPSERDGAAVAATQESRHRSGRRGDLWRGDRLSWTMHSFASPCPSPPPPTHVSSHAAYAQMRDYLASCTELREEVMSVLVHVFRHYATLPVLRPAGKDTRSQDAHRGGSGTQMPSAHTDLSPEEVVHLRRLGRPSFFVLLKLLHSAAVLGDTFALAGAHRGGSGALSTTASRVPGLVPAVLHDALPVCRPAVATYLRRLQVFSTTVSGRDGAAALLFDETLQAQLNSLPPQLGRRRLVAALLWSGLPPSALAAEQREGDQEDRGGEGEVVANGAAFGSGSLAWHVLGSNQHRFFSTWPPQHVEEKEAAAGAPASELLHTNTPADVCALVEDVVKHLWQLAIAVPEPARVVLDLRPHMLAQAAVLSDDIGAAPEELEETDGAASAAAAVHDHVDANTTTTTATEIAPLTAVWQDVDAEDGGDGEDGDFGSDANDDVSSAWTQAEAMEDGSDVAQHVMGDAVLATEMAAMDTVVDDSDGSHATQWRAQETWLAAAADDTAKGEEAAPLSEEAVDEFTSTHHMPLVAALQPALPASQHLFFSLVEALAWVANAQQSHTALPLRAGLDSETSLLALQRVGGAAWCAQLAIYYNLCASTWAAGAGVRDATHQRVDAQHGTDSKIVEGSVLCHPKLVEHILLVLCQTCPDAYLLSLLLLQLAVRDARDPLTSCAMQSALTRRWQRVKALFPWSVECAVAQLLYHAGVTSTDVLCWRTEAAQAAAGTAEQAKDTDELLEAVTTHYQLVASLSVPPNGSAKVTVTRRVSRTAVEDAQAQPPGASRALPSRQDLLMSIGSLLLAALHLRLRSSSGQRRSYPFNFYVDAFLPPPMTPSAETHQAKGPPLCVVLPSVQLKSRAPLLQVPQQITPLWQTWQDGLTPSQREDLRRCFRGTSRPSGTQLCTTEPPHSSTLHERDVAAAAARASLDSNDEEHYTDAFL